MACNTLLSYAGLPLPAAVGFGITGLGVGCALAWRWVPRRSAAPLATPGPWAWATAGGLLVGLRLFHPMGFLNWPLYDEVINAHYALELDRHWSWRPFFFYTQLPPLFIWILAWLYRATGSFLAAIRLEPILISLLILPLSYGAARSLFPRGFSALYTFVAGLGFAALYFGRISHQGILLVLWEYAALACLGKALAAQGTPRRGWLALLGIVLGTGIETYFAWPLVALWVGGMALGSVFSRPKDRAGQLAFLALPALAGAAPFLWAVLHQGYGGYFQTLWSAKASNDWVLQLRNTALVLGSFLWGAPKGGFSYGPVWGGFFNPLAGAALLLGLVEMAKGRREPVSLGLGAGLALFVLPAFLTNSLTDMREIPALPLLSFAAARGLESLARELPERRRWPFLAALLAASTALDGFHLLKERDSLNAQWEGKKTSEAAAAFQVLDRIQRQWGPGWILTSFSNDFYTGDRSLEVATYPFNAALNPRLSGASPRWMALATNVHFGPFLARGLPGTKLLPLAPAGRNLEGDNYDGGLVLALLPLGPSLPARLRDWILADRLFRRMTDRIMDLPADPSRQGVRKILAAAVPGLPRDPLVRSCYWQAVYLNECWKLRSGLSAAKPGLQDAIRALRQGLRQGYPAAYFYNELGSCDAILGDKAQARTAFQKALAAPLNRTPAAENLKALDAAPPRAE